MIDADGYVEDLSRQLEDLRAQVARATAALRAEHSAARVGTGLTPNQHQAFANADRILSDLDAAATGPAIEPQASPLATQPGPPPAAAPAPEGAGEQAEQPA